MKFFEKIFRKFLKNILNIFEKIFRTFLKKYFGSFWKKIGKKNIWKIFEKIFAKFPKKYFWRLSGAKLDNLCREQEPSLISLFTEVRAGAELDNSVTFEPFELQKWQSTKNGTTLHHLYYQKNKLHSSSALKIFGWLGGGGALRL